MIALLVAVTGAADLHIHILGICGTFMGSLAVIAKQLGHHVTGSDEHVYPPMSTQLEEQGIELMQGYDPAHLKPAPDLVVVGNAMSRGNPAVEYVLDAGLRYTSGPQWLSDHLLNQRWVLAVAGTHGKTTTASMLAWVLEHNGFKPGFLIGGVPNNFPVSARVGESDFFVIEADEYDTAFFDKRSKFVHYHPKTLILNNLEFDHADIFGSLADIQRQFHHVVRLVPSVGQVIKPRGHQALNEVIDQGCWSPLAEFGVNESNDDGYWAKLLKADGSEFEIWQGGLCLAKVQWPLTGEHNVNNALATVIAAKHIGILEEHSAEALSLFGGVKRRMETRGSVAGVTVYDDFAHHPTAIRTTLDGIRKRVGGEKVIAVIEPRSNTMRMGVHQDTLAASAADADEVFWFMAPELDWSLPSDVAPERVFNQLDTLIDAVVSATDSAADQNSHIVVMSNGGFMGIHGKLLTALEQKHGL